MVNNKVMYGLLFSTLGIFACTAYNVGILDQFKVTRPTPNFIYPNPETRSFWWTPMCNDAELEKILTAKFSYPYNIVDFRNGCSGTTTCGKGPVDQIVWTTIMFGLIFCVAKLIGMCRIDPKCWYSYDVVKEQKYRYQLKIFLLLFLCWALQSILPPIQHYEYVKLELIEQCNPLEVSCRSQKSYSYFTDGPFWNIMNDDDLSWEQNIAEPNCSGIWLDRSNPLQPKAWMKYLTTSLVTNNILYQIDKMQIVLYVFYGFSSLDFILIVGTLLNLRKQIKKLRTPAPVPSQNTAIHPARTPGPEDRMRPPSTTTTIEMMNVAATGPSVITYS